MNETMADATVVEMAESVHFGKWLEERIAALGISALEFSRRSGIHYTTLMKWFKSPSPRLYSYNLVKAAKGLGVPVLELQMVHAQSAIGRPDLDDDIEPYSEQKVPEIPTFDLNVAAGGWVEISGAGEVCDPAQIDHGLFRVRVRGDSMQPAYKDGVLVEFRCLRVDVEGPEVGRDYYVQRNDGAATFKRLEKMDEETFWLRAMNREKYPKLLSILRQDTVRMALAVQIILPPAWEKI